MTRGEVAMTRGRLRALNPPRRHCEERSDAAIQCVRKRAKLLCLARNDEING